MAEGAQRRGWGQRILAAARQLAGLPPADEALLGQPISRASVRANRSILTGYPADGLTPERLAALLRGADAGDALAYLELAEQMEERDLHYLSVLGTRKRQVAQLPVTVEAASDSVEHIAHADLVREWLSRDSLEAEMFDILDAIGKGYSVTEIVWETSARRWLPARLEWRDPRWFEWDREDGQTLYLVGGPGDAGGSAVRTKLPPFKFIVHHHPAKSGLPIRSGLARPVAWAWLMKAYGLKDWAAFAEVYGFPFRVGRYDAGASEDDIDRLLEAVTSIGVDAACVIPSSMQIDFVDGKAAGSADLYERLCQYLDRQISKAVLGQTATTDADTGGLGSGAEHGEVRRDIERADAKLLAATLQRDLVVPMIALNFGPQRAYPRLRIGRAEEEDTAALVEALAKLVPLGLEVGASTVRDRLGLPDPEPGERLLGTAENRPVERDSGVPGVMTPGSRAPHLLGGSYARYLPSHAWEDLTSAIAASNAFPEAPADVLGELSDAVVAASWKQAMAPLAQAILTALGEARTADEAREALLTVVSRLDIEPLREALARAAFAARIAGEALVLPGLAVDQDDDGRTD
ncbi:DUF935 domain-containing protein [Thermaurantiacus tibetensis]|uniref:DUF935 domain-containing protein n=1 Tax=Thermaurantiacus tibetensis TaxID=2759035 RepID=UPI00188F5C8C|nr:DUF935 domain-containing protein [Thermaurantiacus tibetensis]